MSLFSGAKTQSTQVQQYSGLQVQSAVAGKAIPLVYGLNKVSLNLLFYGFFQSHNAGAANSGKGGGGGGKDGGQQQTYSCAFVAGLCEGVVSGIGLTWAGNNTYASPAEANLAFAQGAVGEGADHLAAAAL